LGVLTTQAIPRNELEGNYWKETKHIAEWCRELDKGSEEQERKKREGIVMEQICKKEEEESNQTELEKQNTHTHMLLTLTSRV
jgi:hypothetical protein